MPSNLVDEVEPGVESKQYTWTLNFGPQHPATHTTLRLVLELDGERIPVKPMSAIYIKPGCRHRDRVGQREVVRHAGGRRRGRRVGSREGGAGRLDAGEEGAGGLDVLRHGDLLPGKGGPCAALTSPV